jgi:hypothetical protein
MALGPFTILVANLFPSQNRQAKKKGLPFLGRQPLVLQLLTLAGAKPSRYDLKQLRVRMLDAGERLNLWHRLLLKLFLGCHVHFLLFSQWPDGHLIESMLRAKARAEGGAVVFIEGVTLNET